MSTVNSNIGPSLLPSRFEGRVQLREGPFGTWIVQDHAQRRGGFFRDRDSAINFIRNELE